MLSRVRFFVTHGLYVGCQAHLSMEFSQPRILKWIAFSRGSSWPRDQTWVSFTADRFFTVWSTKEVQLIKRKQINYSLMWTIWLFFLNWSIVALQCCVSFCYTTTWISSKYTYMPSLLSLPPTPPSHPPRSSQSQELSSLCYSAVSHQVSILHIIVYMCQC